MKIIKQTLEKINDWKQQKSENLSKYLVNYYKR